jgi:hypothetical protein
LPHVFEYSEYDFRNNQALELLEDSLWESNYSAFSHEEYVNLKKNSSTTNPFNKPSITYNLDYRTLDKKFYAPHVYLFFSDFNNYLTHSATSTNFSGRYTYGQYTPSSYRNLCELTTFKKLMNHLYLFSSESKFAYLNNKAFFKIIFF